MDEIGQTTSPTSKVTEVQHIEMTFADAMAEVTEGRKVRREEWPADEYGLLTDGWLSICRVGVVSRWLVGDGDMLATDWMVVKETN